MRWIDPFPIRAPAPLPDLHPLVAQTLLRRGLTTPEAARAFLDPDAYSPAPAADLPGLPVALELIERAIHSHQSICVWGDFDADGQTATAILVQALGTLGADVTYHIPVRARESHGVNIPILTEIIDRGAKLILTCDTGVTSHAAVDYANSREVEMVITDHHDLPETLPGAAALVNPKLLPPKHPLATLSGSGVAFKLAEALLDDGRWTVDGPPSTVHGPSSDLLDLAVLGLVADLAILRGDARYLAQKGLAALRATRRLGLQTMMELAELTPANLTEEHIGFVLGPRLNALGRLGDANPAVDLLTTSDPVRARVLATQLEGLNAQRQLLCNQVTEAAEAQLRADPSLLAQPVLVLSHPAWPGGVVGIVASRLVERYRKPAILFSSPVGEPARGSARSVDRLNITEAIAAQRDLLLNFGGHPMAAGLALAQEKLAEFRQRLGKTVEKMLGEAVYEEPGLPIDCWLDLPDVSLELAAALESLAPYGPGNEKLTLATRGLSLQSSTPIGRNREHLKLLVTDEAGNSQTVLWWNGAGEEQPSGKFDLAYTVRAADWRGSRQVQMEFVDFRLVEQPKIEVKSRKLEVIDHRCAANPQETLAAVKRQSLALVWAEGEDKQAVAGVDRNGLMQADGLVIWTPPPSPEELRSVLEIVRPQKVYLFAVNGPATPPEAFVGHLAGLLKYAINRRQGKVTYSELAAVTAQRVAAVRLGLDWLVSQGEVKLQVESGDTLIVSVGTSLKDPARASRLWAEIRSVLAETDAYRTHFKRADKDILFPHQ